ncbi:MAG: HAMP domain-containing histidine kinase [Kiritimatiellaeota bacterium]|nr:HAMP domain-containing histidine kinase [Kiritimatiellota bacterium]
MHTQFERYLRELFQLTLARPPEEMLNQCLWFCIDLAGAEGGSILAEEGPGLKFLFSNVESLIGMSVPWSSIAGETVRQNVVIYTYAPKDKRHFDGIDQQTRRQTDYLLSIPIPSVHAARASRAQKNTGVLQLLFARDVLPGVDLEQAREGITLEALKDQGFYADRLAGVFLILPTISFIFEVLQLRETSYQVIHELKNKLIAAESWLNCLREDVEDVEPEIFKDESIIEDFELAHGAAHHGARLARAYLQFTKIYAPEAVETNINDVLKKTAANARAFAAEFPGGDVDIALELSDDIPVRSFDPEQMQMAFFNLAKNAVEALKEFKVDNAEVRFVSRYVNNGIEVEIRDNGPGMPEEIASNLFVAFKTKKEGGTGLGLTIAKKIIDVHGGSIDCQTGPSGTRFIIRF